MPNATCSVDQCERTPRVRGWCQAHYGRWKRTGDPGAAPIQLRRTGCLVDGCNRKHDSRGYCKTHAYRLRSNGDPLVTRQPGSPPGEGNPTWRGDAVAYQAVHRRLRMQFGSASTHSCSNCGARANCWAYQHGAPNERICEKAGLPFTTDLSYYEPMCHSCHNQLDAMHGWAHEPYMRRGVCYDRRSQRWRAYATLDGKQHTAGQYATEREALDAAAALRAALLDSHRRSNATSLS